MISISSLHLLTGMTLQKSKRYFVAKYCVEDNKTSGMETHFSNSHVESNFKDIKSWVKFLNIDHFQGYNIFVLKATFCKVNGAIETFQFDSL